MGLLAVRRGQERIHQQDRGDGDLPGEDTCEGLCGGEGFSWKEAFLCSPLIFQTFRILLLRVLRESFILGHQSCKRKDNKRITCQPDAIVPQKTPILAFRA